MQNEECRIKNQTAKPRALHSASIILHFPLWFDLVFCQKNFQLIGAEIGEHLAADFKRGRKRLAGEADHFRVSCAVALDIEFLNPVAEFVEVAPRGDAPRAPRFHVKFKRAGHWKKLAAARLRVNRRASNRMDSSFRAEASTCAHVPGAIEESRGVS